jgi:D-xylose 1-dehydrogenase (NADP+, D-xylono-1,5-lactone-forming)
VTLAVRWGILGTAQINRRLIPAMRTGRRSRLVAIASRDPARARRYAAEWDIPSVHPSYDALLRDGDVDAVYVPLPNTLHVEWTLRALDAGKHVMCEKPLALRPEDVDRIEVVARDRERVVVEGFMYRHEALTARVESLVRSGVVGALRWLSASFTFERTRQDDVRLDPALGGGALWDIGCYTTSITRLLAGGEPRAVAGIALSGRTGVDEAFTGVMEFAEGVTATIHSSFRAAYHTSLEVGGRDGVLRVANPFKPGPHEVIVIERGGTAEHVPVDGSQLLFVRQVEDVVAAILDGRPPTVTLRESRGNAATLAALYEASRTGRVVEI